MPVGKQVTFINIAGTLNNIKFVIYTAGFKEFAMQVQNVSTSGTFVQVVYVLGNNGNIKVIFKFGNYGMCLIWDNLKKLLPAFVVKIEYQRRVFEPAFGRSHFHYIMTLPKAACITKRFYSAFGTNTGTR